MEFSKKINLLPQKYKDKYANKYLLFFFFGIVTVMLLIMVASLINLALINHSINKLTTEDKEYQSRQATIMTLQESISRKQKLIEEYEKDNFPFYAFINAIATQTADDLTIISIDSIDRLISVDIDQEVDSENEHLEETAENPVPTKQVNYEKDLAGEKLIIRGYSVNSSAIAAFINNVSRLFYVADTKLTAIEEHMISNVGKANVFEMELLLK